MFADYENVALGARDAGLDSFRIDLVLERLHDRGKVILKRAYCDWSRYRSAKKPLHEAGFELVEVPHISYSGKNSADIRMAVDAIDLCHTKSHLDGFAVISGDSDFSPLVYRLRENNKTVIGIGVRASTSKLLVEACDVFVFYDDLVEKKRRPSKDVDRDPEAALALFVDTSEALLADRGEPVWGSHIKQVIRRKRPQFDERHYGYRSFNELVRDATARSLVEARHDAQSGGYVVTSTQ